MKVSNAPKQTTIVMSTKDKKDNKQVAQWWKAKDDNQLRNELLGTAVFLKESQGYRMRQASLFARLYGNLNLFNFVGTQASKMDQGNQLPMDRPTFNLVQACTDTLVSRISQSRPSPVFLTDAGDYRERRKAKQLNNFIQGEFYHTEAYRKGEYLLRDSLVEGTGILHVFETQDNRVGLERVLLTELLTDPNESIYGEPRQLYRIKLVDRSVLIESFPKYKKQLEVAEKAYPDSSGDSSKTVADLVLVVEGWRLKSGKDATDGRHTIACSSGVLFDEQWDKEKFPFVFLHYSTRLIGFWAQGLAEQLMGTQMEINQLLHTISKAIRLVGVPRVFVEDGSKVISSQLNNDIGVIVKFRGTKPSYEIAQCVPQELYAQLQRLIDYGFQQSGVSALQASSQKPSGLNSGEAIRSYDDISTDRFASLSKRYDNVYVDLAYLMIDLAMDIAKRDGKYSTVFPNKNGTKEIDLPKMSILKDPFVIQCFNMSSLPRDPAGRMQKITEMIQAGMITIKEGRRLLDYPDLEQVERLDNASEERIFQILDGIVEDGKYVMPDPFMDLQLAKDLVVKYYNLYVPAKLEPERAEMLMNFFNQVNGLMGVATAPQPPQGQPAPQANPEPLPNSPLVPNNVSAAPQPPTPPQPGVAA